MMKRGKKDYFTRKFQKYRQNTSKHNAELNGGKKKHKKLTGIEKKDLITTTKSKEVTEEETPKIISQLKNNKAPGYHEMTAEIIKRNENKTSQTQQKHIKILTKLTNIVIRNGEYPEALKKK